MNYGEIKDAIIARSHRSDLTSHVPEFIALAEADYNQRTGGDYAITVLTDDATNWLTEYAPLVYIAGGLMYLSDYTADDAAQAKYGAMFEQACERAHYAEVKESGVPDQALTTELPVTGYYDITVG